MGGYLFKDIFYSIILLVKDNKFRLDLLHRINTFVIDIPPLRDRPEDIEPLLKHFIKYFSEKKSKPLPKLKRKVINMLCKYDFPGNVRELRNSSYSVI